MSYKKGLIIFPVFLLILGFLVISSPQQSHSAIIPESDCCINNGGLGCDNLECQNFICGIDSYCCEVEWDGICADEAQQYCPVCGGEPTFVRPVPTLNQWALIALAGIMGLSALYILVRRNPLEPSK